MLNLKENKTIFRYLPIIILTVFSMVYISFASIHKMGNFGVETDFYGLYASDAQRILNFEMVQERDHAPGYTFLIAVFTLVFRDLFVAGKALSVVSAIGCLFVFYGLIKMVFNKKVGIVSFLLLAIYLIPYSFIVGIDIVFTFFFLLAVFLFYKADGSNKRFLIWSGIVSGLTFLIRYNGIILPLSIFVILIFLDWTKETLKVRINRFLFYILPFILTVLPWFLFSLTQEGDVSSPGLNAAIAWEFYGPGGELSGDERDLVDPKFNSLTTIVFYDFKHFVTHYVKNIFDRFERFTTEGFYFPAFYFILPGILVAFALSSLKQVSVFVFLLLGFLVLCLVDFVARYYLFVLPLVLVFIALFFFTPIPDNSKIKWFSFKYIKWMAFAFILVFITRQVLFLSKAEISSEPRDLLKIVELLKAKNIQGSIIARKPHLSYFTGLKNEHFPQVETLEDLVNYAKDKNSNYVFYGSQEKKYRPKLSILSEPDSVSRYLSLVYSNQKENNFLYELK